LGESSLGVVLESLVPDYREITSPLPIPTYQGNSIYKGLMGMILRQAIFRKVDFSGKEYSWSRGLGLEVSPIKMRSARKKNLLNTTLPVTQTNSLSENGALRGMKSLAREKS
jgi:hypothetical protein